MLDETKQAFAFKPSGEFALVPAIFAKNPDDVAHKRMCPEINMRYDKELAKAPLYIICVHNCGDVWSDDSSLYFNLNFSHDDSDGGRVFADWNGVLDRATGHLKVKSLTRSNLIGGPQSTEDNWSSVCKKVDKLVDAK